MRSAFLIAALIFCVAFGGMTVAVAAQSGFDIFTLVAFGIVGDDPDRGVRRSAQASRRPLTVAQPAVRPIGAAADAAGRAGVWTPAAGLELVTRRRLRYGV